jgi:hypothetical protein
MIRHYIAISGSVPVPSERCSIEEQSIDIVDGRVVSSDVVRGILKAQRTLPEDGNVIPKHVGDTIHN